MRTALLSAGGLAALLLGAALGRGPGAADIPAAGEPIADCRVVDGDTLRCGAERVRLLGIDAPELRGHCRPGRHCAPGDGDASKASLEQFVRGTLRITRVGTDHYGRTLAVVHAPDGDLSCLQLAQRQAIYRADWDDGGRVHRLCPAAARSAAQR